MRQKFLEHLQFEKRYSGHTLASYGTDLLQLEAFLGEQFDVALPGEVKPLMMRSWVAHLMESGVAPRSIARKMSAAKAFFRWRMTFEGGSGNPAAGLVLPKPPKRLPTYVEEQQMDLLTQADVFPETFEGLRDKAMVYTLYHTGMRVAELVGLEGHDIDGQQGHVKVKGKRNKERIIPVGEGLMRTLKAYEFAREKLPSIKNPASFFLLQNGAKVYPKLVYRVVNRYLGCVSTLQKKSPHVLRHTFATHMLNRGADLNAIKDLLGHASLAATQVYTHNSIEQLKEVHRKAHPKG